MIETKIKVPRASAGASQVNATCPFSGDTSKAWKCRIVDSNLGVDGDPRVNFVRNGMADLTFPTLRTQGMELTLLFYVAGEEEKSAKLEAAMIGASSMSMWGAQLVAKAGAISKAMAKWALALVIGSMLLAAGASFLPIDPVIDWLQGFNERYNMANGARVVQKGAEVVKEQAEEIVDQINDDFFEMPAIKELEKRNGVSYESLFTRVDSEGLYLMTDVFNIDDEPIQMTYSELEERCEMLSARIPANVELMYYIPGRLDPFGVSRWGSYPEWGRDARGLMSDDYIIYPKEGPIPAGSYVDNDLLWGDDGDILLAGRCILMKQDFLD